MSVETKKVTWVSKMGQKYILVIFVGIASLFFATRAFPSLYGDEYDSLFDAYHLQGNIHAIGYFVQLNLWNRISDQDWFLRLLSILWLGLGIYWLNRWIQSEELETKIGNLVILLAVLNPFLWTYGFQVRFYAFFFAASILFTWRFRIWLRNPNGRNLFLMLLGMVLVLIAHLFGAVVVVTVFLSWLWGKLGNKRWSVFGVFALGLFLVFVPSVRQLLIDVVYRASNPYAPVPQNEVSRGLSLAMFAKIPLTFYFFLMGERVYPLWWWITVPSLLIASVAFLFGLWNMRSFRGVLVLATFMLLNIPFLFLVLDPLAPPGLQGAAPRYVIYTLPYLILVLAFGAQRWKFLPYALVVVSLVGLFCTTWPSWSYEQNGDRMDWRQALDTVIRDPQQSCLVVDGRSEGSVSRYAPVGTKIVRDDLSQCLSFPTIVLVSNDFRLSQIRNFDGMEKLLNGDYRLVSNDTLFPAQVTAFEKSPQGNRGQFFPSRLDLPEQDLRFPMAVLERGWIIEGFMRLDSQRPSIETSLPEGSNGKVWLLSNYRVDGSVPAGTPVFSLKYETASGNQTEIIIKAEDETSSWDGQCVSCSQVAHWIKLIHLVGAYSYPGAYSQYEAKIWGTQIKLENQAPDSMLKLSYLLPTGTGYFWGLYSNGK